MNQLVEPAELVDALIDRPIYALTSANTFSGGEELAYDLQALKRATIVGENPRRRAPL
jgi:C-terminal processing protease CtpA/Prc